MSNEGVRIKNPLIRNADLSEVRTLFQDKGAFSVKEVNRTARFITVKFRIVLTDAQIECCQHDAELKIGDQGVTFRWVGVAPRHYYHIDSVHSDELNAIQARFQALWASFEKAKTLRKT